MKIAIEPRPYSDETLSSWLIRTAFANGTDPKSFALAIFKQDSVWYRDLDRYLPLSLKNKLSEAVALSSEQITALTLEPLIANLALYPQENPYKKWHFMLPIGLKGFIKTSGAYFCPQCLQEDCAYLKQEWKLAWNIACSTHKKLLILRCQKCNNTFSPHKLSYLQPHIYLCSTCGFDLRESITQTVDTEVLSFQESLNNIAFHNTIIPFKLITQNKKDLFATLHILLAYFAKANKYNYHSAFLESLNLPQYTIVAQNNATFNRLTVKDREYLLLASSKIFQYTAHEIFYLLKEFGISKQRFLFTYKNLSPTIKQIIKQLPSTAITKKKTYRNSSSPSRVVSPKPESQVDKLFEEIARFL